MSFPLLLLLIAVALGQLLVEITVVGLNVDGVLLLSFKYSIVDDPRGVLRSWNFRNATPCSWRGITCGVPGNPLTYSRVIGISLPSCGLRGSISANLGTIKFLRTLDLSKNSLNGTVPVSLFSAAELQVLDLSNNGLSGVIPESIGKAKNLRLLNLSYNGMGGRLPGNVTVLRNLTVISLRHNYFDGGISVGFSYVQELDLSWNLMNGSLPPNFGGDALHYLNLSHNRISGEIPPEFAMRIPRNATLDLSFNDLTGPIPESAALKNQGSDSYSSNLDLCGLPTKNLCPISSSNSPSPDISAPTSTPATAAFPVNSTGVGVPPGSTAGSGRHDQTGIKPFKIVSIVVAGIIIAAVVFFFVNHLKKKKRDLHNLQKEELGAAAAKDTWFMRWSCLQKRSSNEDARFGTMGSDSNDYGISRTTGKEPWPSDPSEPQCQEGTLVTVDGERELELDTLLKASAYILGATGSSIMYKAVLEDGTALAVRRIGETGLEQFKDFENLVRAVAKLSHPNLVRVRGFYWGLDEKLVIYDFVPNGSLVDARYRNVGLSPRHLPWEARLRIVRGVARGLAYLHERKHVHGNLKPSNILLGADMEPRICDFGLERLMPENTSHQAGGSARNFASERSTASRDNFQDSRPGLGLRPSPSSMQGSLPYHAPESLRSIKASPKWDTYSFGVILLELMAGKVVTVDESDHVNGVAVDDPRMAVRMADATIRGDVEGKEDAMLACFMLGIGCASPVPNKRPSMKEAVNVIEKITSSLSFST